MAGQNPHRSDKQIEATQKNLRRGRRKLHRWTDAETRTLEFPFDHSLDEARGRMGSEEIMRLVMLGATHPEGKGRTNAEQLEISWREEHVAQRRALLKRHVFGKRKFITLNRLLQSVLFVGGSWFERSRRFQEMIANMNILVEVAGTHGYQFPSDASSYLTKATRLSRGQTWTGEYASIFEQLSNRGAQLDLETADFVTTLVMVYNNRFCSRSAAAHRAGKKSAEKRLASAKAA